MQSTSVGQSNRPSGSVPQRGDVVLLPTMGGSVPLGAMERAAETHPITVPIANNDDNQHAANENLRLQNLWAA